MVVKVPLPPAAQIDTYPEAVDRLRRLEEDVLSIINNLRGAQHDLVRKRWEQGRVADAGLVLGGHKVTIRSLAERTNMNPRTLQMAHQFWRAYPSKAHLESRIREWEEGGRQVTWTMARRHVQKRLPDDHERAKAKLHEQTHALQKRAQDLEEAALDLERAVMEYNDTVQVDEALGVAAKAQEVSEDTHRLNARLELEKPKRIEAPDYLAYVRKHPCVSCGAEGVDAHHLDTGGMGTKGPDYYAVPLCRTCHQELHAVGPGWWMSYNPWQKVASLMLAYFLKICAQRTPEGND